MMHGQGLIDEYREFRRLTGVDADKCKNGCAGNYAVGGRIESGDKGEDACEEELSPLFTAQELDARLAAARIRFKENFLPDSFNVCNKEDL